MSAPYTRGTSFSGTTCHCSVMVTMATVSWRAKQPGGWDHADTTGWVGSSHMSIFVKCVCVCTRMHAHASAYVHVCYDNIVIKYMQQC